MAERKEQCSPHGWTIDTLKEFFEARIVALNEQITSRDKALELQAEENKRRLSELNHEHARVRANQETMVSTDTWEAFLKADSLWKQTADRNIQNSMPRSEFQSYKEATDKAITLAAGQSQGVGMSAGVVAQIISGFASLAAIVGVVFVLLRH